MPCLLIFLNKPSLVFSTSSAQLQTFKDPLQPSTRLYVGGDGRKLPRLAESGETVVSRLLKPYGNSSGTNYLKTLYKP